MKQETKLLLDTLMEGCQIIGFDWRYIFINKTAEIHNKRPRKELIGKRYMDMWPGIEETHVFELIKDCLENRNTHKIDNEFTFPDGQVGWFELSIQPIEEGVFILSHDITERKRAKIKLEEDSFYLQEAQQIGQIGTWELDLRVDVLKWTKENYKIFGVEEGTALNYKTFLDCLHPDDKDFVNEQWIEGTKGKPYDIEHRIIANGKIKWVREKAKLFFDDKGEVYKAIGVTQDISKAKEAEIEIRKSKEFIEEYAMKLKFILENISVGISVLDESSEIIFSNQALNKILRLSEKELENKKFLTRKYWNSDNIEIGKDDFPSTIAIQQNKEIHNFEIKIRLEDGNFIWLEVSAFPIEISDWKVITVVTDITKKKHAEIELKESEERFRAVFDQAAVGVAILDTKSGRYLKINKQYCEFLGFSEKELLKKTFMDVTHPEDVSKNITANKNLSERKWTESNFDKRYIRKDGEIVWGNLTVSPLWEHEAHVETFQHVAIVTDINERKLAEETIKATAKKLSEANATKDKFFSIIAHDLRNPFNVIIGMSELLLNNFEDYNKEEQVEFISHINSSGKNTLDLLDNLLQWSRSQSGMIRFIPESIVLEHLFDEIVVNHKENAVRKNIQIDFDVEGSVILTADEFMLRTILRNLLSNAIKFTHDGGNISLFAKAKNNSVFVSVKDDGVGMSKQQLDNLFVLSEKNSSLGTNNEKGTGLGLILCKEFIEKHKGKIAVKSEIGKGSVFEIEFPQ